MSLAFSERSSASICSFFSSLGSGGVREGGRVGEGRRGKERGREREREREEE